MTLEAALESAYMTLLRAEEPTLAAVRVNRAAAGLAQTGVSSDTGAIPFEFLPLPCITLTAARGAEDPPASGVFEVTLTIEAEATDQPTGADLTADTLFSTAIRPLLYVRLHVLLSAAYPALICYGMPRRMDGMSQTAGDATFIRTATATFVCALSQN